jgi:hypothetical protein
MAGKSLTHWGEDTPERFQKLQSVPKNRNLLETFGWIDTEINYDFNSLGFRGHEPKKDKKHFCVFGDSVTFGAAIRYEQTYGYLLEQELGMHCYNFGHCGGSDSTSLRLALTHLPDLNPEFVVYQTTFEHRFEWIDEKMRATTYGVQAAGGSNDTVADGFLYRQWMMCDLNRELLHNKNLTAMRYLCEKSNIPLIEIEINDFFKPPYDLGRDLLHPGAISHQKQCSVILDKLKIRK